MNDLTFAFRSLKGMLPWQLILGQNRRNLSTQPPFVALTFENGLVYRDADRRINSGDELATRHENLVNSGPVTPVFMTLEYIQQASIIT